MRRLFFFKIFSFIVILLFGLWYSKKTKYGIIVLLAAFSLPQTMIHAFSGIETFLFIALVTILLVSIYEEAFCGILISSALLFYTRPESLTLPFIVPLLYCNWQSIGYKDVFNRQHYKWHSAMHFVKNFITIKSLLVFGILLLALLPNLIISYLNFHSILPNTFYVKNISISLGFLKKLIIYGLTLVPLLMSFRYISIKKFVPILLFFSFIVIQYAKTEFLMDYNRRSVYHILCPIVFFIFFIFGQWNKRLIIELKDTESNFRFSLEYKWVCKLFIFALLLLLLVRGIVSDSVSAVNYNYCLLNAHSAAGKVINSVKEKYGINSIACGDAGTLAFNADLDSLDFYELGSSVLTHN